MKPEFKQCLKEYECQLPFSKYKKHLPKFRVHVAWVYFHKFFFFFQIEDCWYTSGRFRYLCHWHPYGRLPGSCQLDIAWLSFSIIVLCYQGYRYRKL